MHIAIPEAKWEKLPVDQVILVCRMPHFFSDSDGFESLET